MSEKQTSTAVIWTLAARQSERVVGIISIAILARLLTPADFGVVGMASGAVALIEVFSAFGFDWAVVRLAAPTRTHYDTAWTMRVMLGVLTATALLLLAGPVAAFYGAPKVRYVLMALAANSLIGSFENIGMANFRREMRFEKEFQLQLATKLSGFVASVLVALEFRSYWALVAGLTASRIATVIGSFVMSSYRPRWCLAARAELMSFSLWVLASNLMEVVRAKFSEVYVGRVFGPHEVGLYNMAAELSSLATTEFAAPINRVAFTRYAQYRGDQARLRESFLKVSGLIWGVGFPASVGIGVCASEIVLVLLGAQWEDSALLVQVLAAAGVLAVMGANSHYVYQAIGRARFVATLSMIGAGLFIPLTIVLGRQFGVTGVAGAQVIAGFVVLVINYVVLLKTLELSIWTVISRNWRIGAASVVMAFVVVDVRGWLLDTPGISTIIRLALMIAAGVGTYVVASLALWLLTGRPQGPERESVELARQWLGRRAASGPGTGS